MTKPSQHPRGDSRALAVGIDVYPFVNAKRLHGCRNDARRVATLLRTRFGFRVSLLLDAKATRKALLQEMEHLLQTTRTGDRIVVHFSGHGSQILGEDGSTVETLVPYDSGRGEHPNRDITDQELYRWVLGLSEVTPFITLIIDSCHSGGAVRDRDEPCDPGEPCRGLGIDCRPGSLADKRAFLTFAAGEREAASRDIGPSGWLPLSERYSLIAACRAGERAREIDDPKTRQHHGILTCFLCEELELERTSGSSHREVFDPVACRITRRFPEQHPQLEGAWDREIFGHVTSIPMGFALVAARRDSEIKLAAGAVHGLVTGSEWQIYPAGTRSAEAAAIRGRVRLDTILAVASAGQLLEETAPGVAVGDRAVEAVRPPGAWRLEVTIDEKSNPMDAKKLGERIDASPYLVRAPIAPLTIRVADCSYPGSSDRLRPGLEMSWVVVAHSGQLVMPPLPVRSPAAVRQLVANLEILARHRMLAELRHPEPNHPLRDTLTIELFRRRPGQDWRLAKPESVYVEGDGLGIHVGHRHSSPLHIGVLDLGLTGSISLLHPVRGAYDPLRPGQELELGLRSDDLALELFVPKELPFPGNTFDQAREILVFIATAEATDFVLWLQKGVRGLEVAREEGGALERDTRPALLPIGCTTWTVTSRSLWLRRSA